MIWVFVAAVALALCAGVGIKWAVDRIWPPVAEQREAYDRGFVDGRAVVGPRPAKVTMLDNTMDVLGAGYEAGMRMGRHVRPEVTSQHLATGLPEYPPEPLEQQEPGSHPYPLPRSLIYRDDPVVPADVLTAGYAEHVVLHDLHPLPKLTGEGQRPAGGRS